MSKYCSDCAFLDLNNQKKEGVYKCKKNNQYICACNCACEKFENSYSRNSYEKQKIYDLGKNADLSEDTPIEVYIFIFIIFCLLMLIAKICGY